jgi:hypothetical protein
VLRAVATAYTGAGGSVSAGGYTDNSGTPGNTTINTPSGRAAFGTGTSACTVTCAACTATSKVLVELEGPADTTLTSILFVTPAAGSFVVTGNAASTANPKFRFVVVN